MVTLKLTRNLHDIYRKYLKVNLIIQGILSIKQRNLLKLYRLPGIHSDFTALHEFFRLKLEFLEKSNQVRKF